MRYVFALLCTLLLSASPALAQFSVGIGIGLPNVRIGINVPTYPNLVPIPGYPVYYVPGMPANYFFYDGMYWAYDNDTWYSSTWYNGPWGVVPPEAVPLFILRVPVQYYARPPLFFRGWDRGGPPHWGEHFGPGWAQAHGGWDHWDHRAVARAPLPTYQRQYSGGRYPGAEQQQAMHNQNYHYQPHEAVVQQHFQAQSAPHPQAQAPHAFEGQHPGGAPAPGGHPPGPQEMHQVPHQESHPQERHEPKREEEHH